MRARAIALGLYSLAKSIAPALAADPISAVVGYRAAGVDYENDGFVYDTVQQGPIIGAVFRF